MNEYLNNGKNIPCNALETAEKYHGREVTLHKLYEIFKYINVYLQSDKIHKNAEIIRWS